MTTLREARKLLNEHPHEYDAIYQQAARNNDIHILCEIAQRYGLPDDHTYSPKLREALACKLEEINIFNANPDEYYGIRHRKLPYTRVVQITENYMDLLQIPDGPFNAIIAYLKPIHILSLRMCCRTLNFRMLAPGELRDHYKFLHAYYGPEQPLLYERFELN